MLISGSIFRNVLQASTKSFSQFHLVLCGNDHEFIDASAVLSMPRFFKDMAFVLEYSRICLMSAF